MFAYLVVHNDSTDYLFIGNDSCNVIVIFIMYKQIFIDETIYVLLHCCCVPFCHLISDCRILT